ncbi:MAG: hypothetical protein Q8R76_07515 [Candidatus Omnitrophota bacterium]|nr:hypothetical protein [Candidatus Omnitrophota bacterium]
MKKAILMLVLAAMVLTPINAFAAASPWTQEATYSAKATAKLAYGFKNAVLGWTELFSVPEAYAAEDKNVLAGIGKGLCNSVVYTVGGLIHTATFLLPIDLPLPQGGVQL